MAKRFFKHNIDKQMKGLAQLLGRDLPMVLKKSRKSALKETTNFGVSLSAKKGKAQLAIQDRPGGRLMGKKKFAKRFLKSKYEANKPPGGNFSLITVSGTVPTLSRFLSTPKKVPNQKGVAVKKRKPVKTRVFKKGGKRMVKKGFVFKGSGGTLLIGMRKHPPKKIRIKSVGKGKKKGSIVNSDLNIKAIAGPSLAGIFKKQKFKRKIEASMSIRFSKRMRSKFTAFGQSAIDRRIKRNLTAKLK